MPNEAIFNDYENFAIIVKLNSWTTILAEFDPSFRALISKDNHLDASIYHLAKFLNNYNVVFDFRDSENKSFIEFLSENTTEELSNYAKTYLQQLMAVLIKNSKQQRIHSITLCNSQIFPSFSNSVKQVENITKSIDFYYDLWLAITEMTNKNPQDIWQQIPSNLKSRVVNLLFTECHNRCSGNFVPSSVKLVQEFLGKHVTVSTIAEIEESSENAQDEISSNLHLNELKEVSSPGVSAQHGREVSFRNSISPKSTANNPTHYQR